MEGIKQFLKSKGMTPKTIKTYCSILEKVFDKIGRNFKEEQAENILAYWDLSPRSYNLYRAVMNFYTKKYLCYEIRFSRSKVNKSLPEYVTRWEINKIINVTINIKHKLQLALMYSSGLRVSEVVKLKKYNFDLDNYELTIREGKGKKDRKTILKISLIHILEKFLEKLDNNDYLFPSGKSHISERTTQEILIKGKRKAGIKRKFTCHDLRHSFSANFVNAEGNIEDLRKVLGHQDISTTQIYLQCKKSNIRNIALKLEQNITQCVI